MSPNGHFVCVLLTITAVGAACAAPTQLAPPAPTPPATESVEGARPRVPAERPVMVGVLVPGAEADVSARLDGTITAVHVRVGQSVNRDDVLAHLANPAVDAVGLGIVEADTMAAQTEVERATLELQRIRGLLVRSRQLAEQQLISQQQLEDVVYQERLATAQVTVREKSLATKKLLLLERRAMLAERDVRAPVSGVVAALFVNLNETVRSGQPLVRIVRLMPVKMRFAVAPHDQAAVRVGGVVRATPESGSLEIPGVVQWITPEVDSLSQLLIAEASIPAEGLMRLGQSTVEALVGRTVMVTTDGQ